jgi:4-amino-4-deoxy-L-arabinose transferase-like glycosyltransferase
MTSKPHFSILATSFAGGPRPRTAALILSGLWLLLFFAALFAPPLLDDADATHASAARAMATTGDLVTLKVDGVRYLEKAPLPYWLVALCYRIFGFNTFATHLPQAIAVLLLTLLGHRWANQAFGARTGFYTAIAVLTSCGVFLFTRIFIPEALLSLLLGAALFAFLKSLGSIATPVAPRAVAAPGSEPTERPALAFYAGPLFYPAILWITLALAVLTKGLVALVLFGLTAFLFLLLTGELRDLRQIRRLYPLSGILLFLLIAAPWHILAGLRNTGGADGHGFFWFYFVNEHILRFLGQRIPRDYNKLPDWIFWLQHLAWLFPWSLFFPLGIAAVARRQTHQVSVLTRHVTYKDNSLSITITAVVWGFGATFVPLNRWVEVSVVTLILFSALFLADRRRRGGLTWSPFHRIDPQQRTILLLALFASVVLLFFSLSTNQEYYTFPIYMPLLLLIAATITRAEQTYATDAGARRLIRFAHASFTVLGALIALALAYGLWSSRNLPFVANVGDLLAHRNVADYTLSMSHLFDLTTASFAALRLPTVLAMLAFLTGPGIAWMLRMQRRHIAATTTIAFTAAVFLVAAQIAFARFGAMLSSEGFASRIQTFERDRAIAPNTRILLYGDQSNGSSIPFYLGRQVEIVDGRSSSLLFGATFPDTPPVFLSDDDLKAAWAHGPRHILFVPPEFREHVATLLGPRQIVLDESSGKLLLTDRPLDIP